jgi:hypothetical protein
MVGENHFGNGGNKGIKIHGSFTDSKLKLGSLSTDEWHYVEVEGKNTYGDGGHILLIFDGLPKSAQVRYSNFI